jgi:riboflavin synthase
MVVVSQSCSSRAVQAEAETLNFDVMMETLRATSLGGLQAGGRVNFERAAKFGDEVGAG